MQKEKNCKYRNLFHHLCSRDFDSGIINVLGVITTPHTAHILSQIRELKRRKLKEVFVNIFSQGGEIASSFAIYDALRDLSTSGIKVIATVEGIAASAAAMIILQAANVRQSRPSARFLLHEIKRWAQTPEMSAASVLKDEADEINKLSEMIVNILSKRCKKTKKEVKKTFERKDVWLSAQEAKDWSLIDRII